MKETNSLMAGIELKYPVESRVIKATGKVNTKKWDHMEEGTVIYGEGRIREDLQKMGHLNWIMRS